MANTMALQDTQSGERVTVRVYKVTLSGSYVVSSRGTNTGELLVPNSASNPFNQPSPTSQSFDRAYPLQGPGGNACEIIPGADAQHWLLRIFSAANTELVAGAYNAAVTGDLDFFVAFESKSFR